ncbi:MAG: TlpA family protein disulfide reductase [Alphaproteobacteria bacterium]
MRKSNSLILNIALLAGLILTAYSVTLWLDRAAPPVLESSAVPLPDFSFTALNGKTYTSTDFKNKIVVLNFWASWCAPCVKEFPDLLKIVARHKKDLVLIALSSDLDEAAIKNFGKRAKLSWTGDNIFIALDRDDVGGKLFGITRLPETLIFDRQGALHTKLVGAEWTISEFENILEIIN